MIQLLIVEDQSIVLDALSALLNLEDDMSVVATASNGAEALTYCKELAIDIVISDIEMPEMDGLTLAKKLQTERPTIKTIILTTFSKAGYINRSKNAKVAAYLLKDSPADFLVSTIREVDQGNIVVDPNLATDIWRADSDPLTKKEKTLLILAHQGLSSIDIALKMNLSAGTIRNYAHAACQKLNAKNRVEAANIAYQQGWI